MFNPMETVQAVRVQLAAKWRSIVLRLFITIHWIIHQAIHFFLNYFIIYDEGDTAYIAGSPGHDLCKFIEWYKIKRLLWKLFFSIAWLRLRSFKGV